MTLQVTHHGQIGSFSHECILAVQGFVEKVVVDKSLDSKFMRDRLDRSTVRAYLAELDQILHPESAMPVDAKSDAYRNWTMAESEVLVLVNLLTMVPGLDQYGNAAKDKQMQALLFVRTVAGKTSITMNAEQANKLSLAASQLPLALNSELHWRNPVGEFNRQAKTSVNAMFSDSPEQRQSAKEAMFTGLGVAAAVVSMPVTASLLAINKMDKNTTTAGVATKLLRELVARIPVGEMDVATFDSCKDVVVRGDRKIGNVGDLHRELLRISPEQKKTLDDAVLANRT